MIEPSLGYFTGYENGNWLFLLVSVFFLFRLNLGLCTWQGLEGRAERVAE